MRSIVAFRASVLAATAVGSAAIALYACDPQTTGDDQPQAGRAERTLRLPDGTEVITREPYNRRKKSAPAQTKKSRADEHLIRTPNSPDPQGGDFTLQEAVAGLPVDGGLVAEIGTDFGTIFCDLFADRAPRTVANFIGLARGLREFWDPRQGQWTKRPYYDNLTIHRIIPNYMIQGGDLLGDGSGRIGYTIPAEMEASLRHDRAGRLSMAAEDGPNTSGAQFFITDGASPQLDGRYTAFGQCLQTDTIATIARLAQHGAPDNRPLTPIHITRLRIRRERGGAVAARPPQPQIPEAPRGASAGPGERYPGVPGPAPRGSRIPPGYIDPRTGEVVPPNPGEEGRPPVLPMGPVMPGAGGPGGLRGPGPGGPGPGGGADPHGH